MTDTPIVDIHIVAVHSVHEAAVIVFNPVGKELPQRHNYKMHCMS